MRVVLKDLQPNPFRDSKVDPIKPERVEKLLQSIKEDGFWGGVAIRKAGKTLQIAAGHHRIQAAIAAKIDAYDLFVSDSMTDAEMIRIYGRENATQRGSEDSHAVAGTVAAAVRYLVRAIATGEGCAQLGITGLAETRGNLASDRGLGRAVVAKFLEGVPGINVKIVEQQLACLKEGGHYTRIVNEVHKEIEQEHEKELKELAKQEAARKAAELAAAEAKRERETAVERYRVAKAAEDEANKKRAQAAKERAEKEAKEAKERQVEAEKAIKKLADVQTIRNTIGGAATAAKSIEVATFDYDGVSAIITNPHQLDVFRKQVTGPALKELLPVKNQAAFARSLVTLADKNGQELTGRFIQENAVDQALQAKETKRKLTEEEKERALREDWQRRFQVKQEEFISSCGRVGRAWQALHEAYEDRPENVAVRINSEFREAVQGLSNDVEKLMKTLRIK